MPSSRSVAVTLLALGLAHALPAHAQPAPDTLSQVVPMAPVEVSTTRAGERPVVAAASLRRSELQRANWGQDTPMLLATLPGAFAYSDAGNGVGYSYLTLRGFPQRRIKSHTSVSLNGSNNRLRTIAPRGPAGGPGRNADRHHLARDRGPPRYSAGDQRSHRSAAQAGWPLALDRTV